MKKYVTIMGVAALSICTAAAQEYPRNQVFLGYNFTRFNPNSGFIPSFNANGGSGQFAHNFNKWLGLAIDVGAVNKGTLGGFNVETTVLNFVAGPRVTFHNHSRFTPFVQALFGGAYTTTSTQILLQNPLQNPNAILPPGFVVPPNLPISGRLVASRTGFAMLAGGGLDIKLSRHIAFRPIGADYYLMRLPGLVTGNDTNINNFRYSAGFAFNFGGEQPTPPPAQPQTKTCPDGSVVPVGATCPKKNMSLSLAAANTELCPGDTTQVNANLAGAGNQMNYVWSVNGQPVGGQGHSFMFGTEGRAPGTYHVGLSVNGTGFNPASADTTITVKEYQPPTGSAQANPAQINAGEKSSLSASFQNQCGGPIQAPTFTASEGSVQGDQFDSTGVQWDPSNSGEQRKTVTITASAADNKSTGTATTQIEVIRKAVVTPVRLPDVLFSPNSSRVNNCGKRILLEQLRGYYERDSGGTVVLVGNNSSGETAANLAQQRAMNSAAVITAGKGVCLSISASQVQISSPGVDQGGVSFESGFCGPSVSAGSSTAAQERRVQVWFVPSGGQMPASVTNYQNASALNVSSIGCPK
jgi:hypothetical protein